ncbi:MAG: hypothetical protein H6807_10365 [Planctomycetes bacterium]|nr:hypothetical protein [Planctomycetota bacterium]
MTPAEAAEALEMVGEEGREPLLIENRMREIEGRRFSGRARWRDRRVFYKVFVAVDRIGRHIARERAGAAALAERGFPGPHIIHEAAVEGPGIPARAKVLLFDWLDGAENVDDALRAAPSETRTLALLREVARLLGRHHAAGLVQKDLHLANFAIAGEAIHTFDAASIEARKGPVSRGAALDNLALFFAQVDPGWDSAIPMLLDAYAEEAGADMRPDLDRLRKRIDRERRRRMSRFLDKVLRPCRITEVLEIEGRKVLLARPADDDLRALATTIERGPEPTDGLGLAYHGETIRLRVYGSTQATGAERRAWRNAQRLVLDQVATPAPLACGPAGGGWYLADQPVGASLESLVAEAAPDLTGLAAQAAQILLRLDQLGLEHGRIGRRSFVRLRGGALGLTDLEELDDRAARAGATQTRTSADMLAALECWKGQVFADLLLAALQRRGYALDLA